MPDERSWEIAEPRTLTFDGPVEELRIRIVDGAVNVVGTDAPRDAGEPGGPGNNGDAVPGGGSGRPAARVEVSALHGPPLRVLRRGRTLVVAYDDLTWKGLRSWRGRKRGRREAVVSVSVPAAVRLSVGVVGASAMVSGVRGPTQVRVVAGHCTLAGLSGDVTAETVSGNVEAQDLSGSLRVKSVSGELTLADGGGSRVRAQSVSGAMILDLDPSAPRTDVALRTVSGEIAVRLPPDAHARVDARTVTGAVSSVFEELSADGRWGAGRLTGTLGTGSGRLRAATVSGPIALLRRPQPWSGDALLPGDAPPGEAAPGDRDDGAGDVPRSRPEPLRKDG
ncbi:DUF4097 family beta strand repeat-containing protein [Streptomyces sp. JJ36]|uniref:DUF4097 family beta strand repeat-containing protein n=1 Tax=Streptomyces sp. JJ36 TaxID=2736645 RepID=UPI001F39FFD2|nr:DUF4097 family beta strand repeat-containing protein [Streptomyces sp. JJ36]